MVQKLEILPSHLAIARRLAKLNEPLLYESLGMQCFGLENPFEIKKARKRATFSLTVGFAERKGRTLFKKWSNKLKKAICEDWKYCDKAAEYENDFDKLISSLAPIVAATLGLGQAAIGLTIVVCVLLFKYGLRRFCRCKS